MSQFKYFLHTMVIFRNETSPLLDKELDNEGNPWQEYFQNYDIVD